MSENNIVREYRRGFTYRQGNISEDKFLSELKFGKIIYSETLSNEERQRILNYTYDALYDLSDILDISPYFLSLRTGELGKTILHIGQKVGNRANLLSNAKGKFAYNWFKLLDFYMGTKSGYIDGIVTHLSEDKGFYASNIKQLLSILKYKEGKVDTKALIESDIKENIEAIINILDTMPLFTDLEAEEYNIIEGSRNAFISSLTLDTYVIMIENFAKFGFRFDKESDNKIRDNLIEIERKKRENQNSNKENYDLVETDYYKLAKELDRSANQMEYSTDLSILAYAFNTFVDEMLKVKGNYNNFLVKSYDDAVLKFVSRAESNVAVENYQRFFSVVLPQIVKEISELPDIEDAVNNSNTSEALENTDIVEPSNTDNSNERELNIADLEEDNDKFKITLFKKLAKDNGLELEDDVKIVSSCYFITVNNSYIRYIKAPLKLYSKDKKQKIDIDCILKENKNTRVHEEYVWDYALDYNAFVAFLVNLHEQHKTDAVLSNNVEYDFDVMEFKKACISVGLAVSEKFVSENAGFYIFNFNTKSGGVLKQAITSKTYQKEESNRMLIKFVKDVKYTINWNNTPKYIQIAKKILEITNKEANSVPMVMINVNKSEVPNAAEKRVDLLDVSNINTSDDLRRRLVKFVNTHVEKSLTVKLLNTDFNTIENILMHNYNNQPKYNNSIYFNNASLSKEKAKGHSKAWSLNKQGIIIGRNNDNRKAVEGIIESFVHIYIKYSGYKEKEIYEEMLTYMLCKAFGLDVRTYCMSLKFDNLISNKVKLKNVLEKVYNEFYIIFTYFVNK